MRVSLILTLSLLVSAPAFAQQSLLDILQKSYEKAKSSGKVVKPQGQIEKQQKEEVGPSAEIAPEDKIDLKIEVETERERVAPLERLEPVALRVEMETPELELNIAPIKESEPRYFPVKKNNELLSYFDDRFAYKFKGKKRFGYRLENVHYYQLRSQKDLIVAYNSDYSLDGFNNFIIMRIREDGSFDELFFYNSQEDYRTKFSMEMISEALCGLDQECFGLNEKRKEEEKHLRETLADWESTNLEKIKERLVQALVEDLENNSQINVLPADFKAEKIAQYREILNNAKIIPGEAMQSLRDAVSAAWRDELYEEDFSALFAKLKTMSKEQQEVELAKRGLFSQAGWLIKKNYENFLVESVHSDCRNFEEAPEHEAYCEQFVEWDDSYRQNTSRNEIFLIGSGQLKL